MAENKRFVKFSPPLIEDEEIAEVVDTLRSGWITTGPKTRQFEEEFADYVRAPAALAVNSCTAALHTALVASKIGPGDEVITSTMTFAASVNVIEHVGAKPVLTDVCPQTLNLSVTDVARKINGKTKAIIPVHFAGQPADLDAIHELARKHNLLVLEDAAHALPAKYRGQFIGGAYNPVAFSFYATKNLTTGEGGMLTGEKSFIDAARVISLHGLSREAWRRYERGGSWRYDVGCPGFKYNMTDIQAAIGIWQLRKLERFDQRRREVVHRYQNQLGYLAELELPTVLSHVGHAWHLFVVRLNLDQLAIDRDTFVEKLNACGVSTSVHFIPIHHHSYYRGKYAFQDRDFPVASQEFERMVSLPLNPSMSEEDVQHVIDTVRAVTTANSRRRMAA